MTDAFFGERGKAQWIRIADVVLIGPLMIWGGAALARRSSLAGAALAGLGVATIVFNGRNWLRVATAPARVPQCEETRSGVTA